MALQIVVGLQRLHVMSLVVNGVILVARCFNLIAKNTDAIAITSPIPNTMLNATGLG
jgi:hypothetical protein